MIWTRFRQKHENFRKSDPGSPRFFCFKHFFRSWSTCGNLKICCNFQWVLVVVRDVEKESEIESEGLQKKGIFFKKTRFWNCKNVEKLRVSRVLRLLRALGGIFFAARKVLRTVVCYSFSHETFIFSGRKSGVWVHLIRACTTGSAGLASGFHTKSVIFKGWNESLVSQNVRCDWKIKCWEASFGA